MARDKKLVFGAINITIHPHSPEKYINLLNDIKKTRDSINVYGDSFLMMTFFGPQQKGQDISKPYIGEFLKFTEIDGKNWFNIETKDTASDEDIKKINIPPTLKPNGARFFFVFLPDVHLLVYEISYDQKNLPVSQLKKYFNNVVKHPDIIEKYGIVNITVLTEPNEVERMLSLKGINSITLRTVRPNPDSLQNAEAIFQKRLQALHVIQEEKTLKAEKGKDIKPDNQLKQESLIASRNGFVHITRKNESGHTETLSSQEKPIKRHEMYNPNTTQPIDLLILTAYSIKNTFERVLNYVKPKIKKE